MNPIRRSVLAAGTLAALGFRPAALAQDTPVAGRNYSVLNPALPVEAPAGKIEVLEFFWYGCIHCYNFEPHVEKWLKTAPADVAFRQVPAIFNDRWLHDARIYYAFEAMGLTAKTHMPLFDAIHKSRLDTTKAEMLLPFLTRMGADVKKFEEALKSFGVQTKVKRAAQMTAAYHIDGTPSLAVHGAFTVSADQGGTAGGMFAIADHLVGLVRKSGPAKPAGAARK